MEKNNERSETHLVSSGAPDRQASNCGPPTGQNSNDGPPTGQNLGYGPPTGQSPDYGLPTGQASNCGPPTGQSPDYGLPTGQNLGYGPPTGQSPDYGLPTGQASNCGPPTGQSPGYGLPTGQNPDYGLPTGQNPDYGLPTGQASNCGPPTGQSPGYGLPTGQNPDYGLPTGQNPDYGLPTGQASNCGPPTGQSPGYGLPTGQNPDYGLPTGQNPDYGLPTGQASNCGPPTGQSPGYGLPTGQNPDYGLPTGQNPDYGLPTGQASNCGPPIGQSPDYGLPTGQASNCGPPTGQSPGYGLPTGQNPDYGLPTGQNPDYGLPTGQASNCGPPTGQSPGYGLPTGQNPDYGLPTGQNPDYGLPTGQASNCGPPTGQSPGYVPPTGQHSNYCPPAGQNLTYGSPAGQNTGFVPPTGQNTNFGPPTGQNPDYGPPTGQHSNCGPPAGQNLTYGPPAGQNLNYGPPTGQHSNCGPPAGQNLTYGPPAGQNSNYGPPAGQNLIYGPPAGQNLKYGPPTGQNLNYGPPAGQNLNYGPPAGQNLNYGPPTGQNLNYGPPAGQNLNYGPPTGQNLNYGPPTGQNLNYGPPAGQNSNYGPPAGQNSNYGPPTGQHSNYGPPTGPNPANAPTNGQEPGASTKQNPGKKYSKHMTSTLSGTITPQNDDVDEVSSMLDSLSISSSKLNRPYPEQASVNQGEKTPGRTSIHATHCEEGTETGADFQGSSSKRPEKAQQYLGHMVMVSGIKPESQEDDLTNFLEAVFDDDVVKIKYTEDRDVAVVIFQGIEDFAERETKYHKKKKKSFFGQILVLSPLLPSCCISVHGIGKDLVQGSLEKYFESRECGNDRGAQVLDSLMRIDKGYAILTFEDSEVVGKILMKTEHVLDGKCISVGEHYTETGSPVYDKNEMKLMKVVDDLLLVDARLLMVLKFPESCAKKWKGLSAVCDGESSIVFDGFHQDVQSAVEDLNDLRDTISKHVKCMKDWSDIQLSLLQKFSITEHILQQISETFIQGAWQCDEKQRSVTVKAMSGRDLTLTSEIVSKSVQIKKIEALSLQHDDKELLDQELQKALKDCTQYFLLVYDTDSVIVCAPAKYISRLTRAAERSVKEISEKKKRALKTSSMVDKHLIVDQKSPKNTASTLKFPMKPLQARFIHVKMKEDIHELASLDVTITIDPAGNGLIVKGPESELTKARGFLRSTDRTLKVKEVKEEGPYVNELEQAGLISVIAEYAEKTIRCVVKPVVESLNSDREEQWTTNTGLAVHVFQGAVANLGVRAVITLVDENLKPMDRFASSVQEKGGKLVKEKIAHYLSKNGVMKQGQVLITEAGDVKYDKIIHVCFKKEKKSDEERQHALSTALTECLQEAHKNNLDSIAIPTFGPALDIGDAMKVTRIVTETLSNYFKGKSICPIKHVYLLSRNEHSFNAFTTNGKFYLPEKGQTRMKTNRSQRVFAPELEVKIVTADLAEQKVDVIVNTVNVDLDLNSGAISKSLLKAGGSSLQTECRQRHPGGVATGKFVPTQGTGMLQCKEVYHCCLPSKNIHELAKVFKRLIQNMLETASDTGHSTIAFPSLGTGNVGYKHKDVAAWMFEAVRLYKKTKLNSRLTGITMVIHHKDNKSQAAFTEMHEKYMEKRHGAAAPNASTPQRTYAAAAAGHSAHSHSGKRNGPNIELKEGEIADQKVDVIVNTASNNLDLNMGNVSRSILTKGGKAIQDEVRSKCGYKASIPDGNLVVSHGGELKCRFIYHGVLNGWGGYSGHRISNTEFLVKLVKNCLDKASKYGSKTIAFPALGTGLLGYPHDVVANTMYDVVKNYGPTSLKTVFFVVYDKDTRSKEVFKKEHARYKAEILHPPGPSQHSVGHHSGRRSLLDAVTVKVGNILAENCDCIVVPVDPNMDFNSEVFILENICGVLLSKLIQGSISRLFLETSTWSNLLKTCHEQKLKLMENGVLLVSSFKTCAANMVLFVDRDMVKTNQQLILSTSLATADKGSNYQVAFPMLMSGRSKDNAAHLARDLYKALEEFAEGSLKTLIDIRVIVSNNDMKATFESEMKLCKERYHEKQNQASGSQAFEQETLEAVAQSTTQPSHKHACVGSSKSAHESSKTRVTYQVVSDKEMSIEHAIDVLQRLSTDSQTFTEEIHDDRLKRESRETKRIEDLSQKFEIKVKVDAGKVKLVGTSFRVCQALKEVLDIISSLPNVTDSNKEAGATTTSIPNSESHKHNISDNSRSKPCVADNIFNSVHQDVRPKPNNQYDLPGNKYIPINVSNGVNENEMYGSGGMTVCRVASMEAENTDSVDRTQADSAPDTPINDLDKNTEGEMYGSGDMSGNRHISMETENTDSVDRSTAASRSFDEAEQEDDKVEWFFVEDADDGLGLQSYDIMTRKIEAAYLNGDCSISIQGQEEDQYEIDFGKMEEYSKENEMDRVPVIRRQKLTEATTTLPEKLRGIDPYRMKLVPLVWSSSEFMQIAEMFTKATHLPSSSLVKIEEILNISLYKSYESKKAQMLTQGLKQDELNEKQLWHGPLVNTDVIVSLSHFGFNRNYCNYSEEDDLGHGVYFHTNIEPILKHSQADPSGHHHVCLSKVLAGKVCVGRQAYRDAPDACHSVVDIDSNPSKFAVFFDNQALPQYLLTFTAEHK